MNSSAAELRVTFADLDDLVAGLELPAQERGAPRHRVSHNAPVEHQPDRAGADASAPRCLDGVGRHARLWRHRSEACPQVRDQLLELGYPALRAQCANQAMP